MLQIGLSDNNLQRELGAIRNPTLDAFSDKIEGFEQAKRTGLNKQNAPCPAVLMGSLFHVPTRMLAVGIIVQLINLKIETSQTKIEENETDISHCEANASGAHVRIT